MLIEIGQILGSYRGKFTVIGGAVPWVLLNKTDMPHIGTVDIDLSLDAEALGDGEYAQLVESLTHRGYRQSEDHRKFQLIRTILANDERNDIEIIVDFLMPRDAEIAKNTPPLVPSFAVQRADGADRAWSFPEVGYLSVCKPDESMDRAQVVASLARVSEPFSPSNPLELIVFNTDQLTSLDGVDGAEDGSIELETVLAQETSQEVWHISFGQLTSIIGGAYVGCAGDFDGDGHEDIAVTLTHLVNQRMRGHIILFAYSDLIAIDRLDGAEDYRVNAELLWPGG